MQTTYIELAGIPIEVRSQYNSDFLQEFTTNRPPLLKVEPGEEDLARMRKALEGHGVCPGRLKSGRPGVRITSRTRDQEAEIISRLILLLPDFFAFLKENKLSSANNISRNQENQLIKSSHS